MSAHMEFWLEVRRAIARWTGVMIASVICGLLLGLLRREGVPYKAALEMALPVGFLLALLFWVWVTYRFSRESLQLPLPASATVPTFEGQFTAEYSFQMMAQPTIASNSWQAPGAAA
jgi:hypothetical protein